MNNADNVWLSLVSDIILTGKPARPRGIRIKEILSKSIEVDMKKPIVTVKARKIGYRFLAAEAWWILSGRNDVASIAPYSRHISLFSDDGNYFSGAYGPRIVDQLTYVVDTLAADPDSRQAVIDIWRPNPRDSRDIPCTLSTQWLIRDGKLHCIDTMRSSDAWLGIVYDVPNFSMLSAYLLLLLRKRAAQFYDIDLGTLFLTAGSSHLYIDPAADGNKSIPYSLDEVSTALVQPELQEYNPLSVNEFHSPTDFIEHLSLIKDNRDSGHIWLAEFLLAGKSK